MRIDNEIFVSDVLIAYIYYFSQVYLEYVVKNPLCQLNEPIQSELFKLKVDELLKKSPLFLSRSI